MFHSLVNLAQVTGWWNDLSSAALERFGDEGGHPPTVAVSVVEDFLDLVRVE